MENVFAIVICLGIIFFAIYLFKKFNIKLPLLIVLFLVFLGMTAFVGECFFDVNNKV